MFRSHDPVLDIWFEAPTRFQLLLNMNSPSVVQRRRAEMGMEASDDIALQRRGAHAAMQLADAKRLRKRAKRLTINNNNKEHQPA